MPGMPSHRRDMHLIRNPNRRALCTSRRNTSATTWVALGWKQSLPTSGNACESLSCTSIIAFFILYIYIYIYIYIYLLSHFSLYYFIIAFFIALNRLFRAVAGEGIPESYLPKTCVHQWEGHTKVPPLAARRIRILVTVYFRVSIASDGYPSGVICYSARLLITLLRYGMCTTPAIFLPFHMFPLHVHRAYCSLCSRASRKSDAVSGTRTGSACARTTVTPR
jgi:hypothetical protein